MNQVGETERKGRTSGTTATDPREVASRASGWQHYLDPVSLRAVDQATAALMVILGALFLMLGVGMGVSKGRLREPASLDVILLGLGAVAVALGVWSWRRIGTRAGRWVVRAIQLATLVMIFLVKPGLDLYGRGRWIDALTLVLGLFVLGAQAFAYLRWRRASGRTES